MCAQVRSTSASHLIHLPLQTNSSMIPLRQQPHWVQGGARHSGRVHSKNKQKHLQRGSVDRQRGQAHPPKKLGGNPTDTPARRRQRQQDGQAVPTKTISNKKVLQCLHHPADPTAPTAPMHGTVLVGPVPPP